MIAWPYSRTVVAFCLPITIYLLTLAPTVYNLDSAELTTAAAIHGLTRSTGYPLYLILGSLWTHLPIGDIGYRMNLFSAVSGALSVALAERILSRLDIGSWATFAALGLLATAPYYWGLSLIAEVYTLHIVLMALLILLLLRWGEQPTALRLAAIGFTLGLGLSHHASMILLLPGCTFFVLATHPRQAIQPKALSSSILGLLIGICFYLYLPLSYQGNPAFNYAGHYDASGTFHPVDLTTISGIWWLVSGRSFTSQMLAYSWNELLPQVVDFSVQLSRAFFVIGIGPGTLGMVIHIRRQAILGATLLIMFVSHAAFYIDYRVADKVTMFLPNYLIWALWIGIGVQWLMDWVSAGHLPTQTKRGLRLIKLILLVGVLVTALWNWSLVDLSDNWSARERGEAILQQLQPNALLLGYWDTVPIVEYLIYVEHRRPDVKVINRFLIGDQDMKQLIRHSLSDRPVYIDSLPEEQLIGIKAQEIDLLPTSGSDPIGTIFLLSLKNNPNTIYQTNEY